MLTWLKDARNQTARALNLFHMLLCILLCSAIKKINNVLSEPSNAAEEETKAWSGSGIVISFMIFLGGEGSAECISVGSMVSHFFELVTVYMRSFLL